VEGLCHNSEVDGGAKSGKKVALEEGKEYDFRVLRTNAAEKKIGLSLKEVARAAAPVRAPEPAPTPKKPPAPMTTMAEAFSSAGITTSPAAAAAIEPAPQEAAEATKEQPVPQGD
jgi:ribosomal protein S1